MTLSFVNGGASRDLGLKILRVQGKGGLTDVGSGPGRPTQDHPGPAQSPLRASGSSGDYALCPIHLRDFGDVILVSKMEVLVVWTSLGPLPRWVPGPTTRWAPGTTRLALHDT
jgi:hypothetical protein